MEIKSRLEKPYTENERLDFIAQQSHNLGYLIEETSEALEAWGYTEEELAQKEKEKKAMLSLTRGDVFRALLLAKGVTRNQIRALIENDERISEVQRELALIDFDEALNFYRGNELITELGAVLEITSEQLDRFFETNDYTVLLPKEETETFDLEG